MIYSNYTDITEIQRGIDYLKADIYSEYLSVKTKNNISIATFSAKNSSISINNSLTDLSTTRLSERVLAVVNLEDTVKSAHFDVLYELNQGHISNIAFGIRQNNRNKFSNKLTIKTDANNTNTLASNLVEGFANISGGTPNYLLFDLDRVSSIYFPSANATDEEIAKVQAESWNVEENVSDKYLRFDFSTTGKYALNGNFGLYYVKIKILSKGAVLNHSTD